MKWKKSEHPNTKISEILQVKTTAFSQQMSNNTQKQYDLKYLTSNSGSYKCYK